MRIIYKNNDNSIAVLIPTAEALSFATIEQIAVKDVPHKLPFWVVNSNDIPMNRADRDLWELDETVIGKPTGYGGESNEFDAGVIK